MLMSPLTTTERHVLRGTQAYSPDSLPCNSLVLGSLITPFKGCTFWRQRAAVWGSGTVLMWNGALHHSLKSYNVFTRWAQCWKTMSRRKLKEETFVSIITERMGWQRQFWGLHGDLLKNCSNSGQMTLAWWAGLLMHLEILAVSLYY